MSHPISLIANMQTVLKREDLDVEARGYHESLLRSFHIVKKLRDLLERKVDHEVILEILDLMESDAFQPYAFFEQRYKEQGQPIQTEPASAARARKLACEIIEQWEGALDRGTEKSVFTGKTYHHYADRDSNFSEDWLTKKIEAALKAADGGR